MSEHVASVCRSCCFQLRQLRAVQRSITMDAAKTLVRINRLHCNSLLAGTSDSLIWRMQLVQNAAARLVTGLRKFDHIKSTLRDLHWLPVRQRINYKVALLVYKCLHGLASSYLADDCRPVYRLWLAGDNCGLLTPECWLSQERVRRSVQDPLRYTAQLYGTSCQLNYAFQARQLIHSPND